MALIARLKTWSSTEDVTASDLNAEFNNILDNLSPSYIEDYSANVSQMQTTVDPGEVGSESLPTTLAGELARIRHMITEITGENEWYESPVSSITGLANAVGTGLTDNRLVSGRKRTDVSASLSAQPVFLVPNGAARTIKLDGTPVSFIYYIEGVEYTIDADVTLTNLTAAPSSNNTCLINDAVAADQYWTKYAGEDGSEIPVDTMGSEISALIGKFAAFKLDNGSATEYFIAYVKSSTSLTKARRGYFFDSSDNPKPRIAYSNNDTITLLKLTWVFAKSDETLTVTYNNPVWSDDEPSSPSIGDYWFDTSANKWKKYDVASYIDADAILVGVCVQDSSNTIGARSFDFFDNYDALNTLELTSESNTQVKARFPGSQVSVYGSIIQNPHNITTWDMTLDLESGVTEASSTYYYFYLTETGDKVISDKKPHDRREDLLGHYHPDHSWRCVGWAFNNASSNLEQVESFYRVRESEVIRSVAATDALLTRDRVLLLSGASFTEYLPDAALCRGNVYKFIHNGTSLSQVYTLDGFGAQTIGGSATVKLHTNGQVLTLISDGSNWLILESKTSTGWVDGGALSIGATTSAPTKPTGLTVDKMYWRRNGSEARILFQYKQSNTTGAAAGTGDYLYSIPSGLTIDTTNIVAYTTVEGSGGFTSSNAVGSVLMNDTTNANHTGAVVIYDSTQVRIAYVGGVISSTSQIGFLGQGGVGALNTQANLFMMADFTVPIVDWLP